MTGKEVLQIKVFIETAFPQSRTAGTAGDSVWLYYLAELEYLPMMACVHEFIKSEPPKVFAPSISELLSLYRTKMRAIDEKVLWALWYDGVFGNIKGTQDEYAEARVKFDKALSILNYEHDLKRWPIELIDIYHAKRQSIFPQYSDAKMLDTTRQRMIR